MKTSLPLFIVVIFLCLTPIFGQAQGRLKVYDNLPMKLGTEVREIPNGYRIIAMPEFTGTNKQVLLTDQDGDFVSLNALPQPPAFPTIVTSDGNKVVASTAINIDPAMSVDIVLTKTNPLGDTLWTLVYPMERSQTPKAVLEMPNGELMVVGTHFIPTQGIIWENQVFALNTDAAGNFISYKLHLANESYHLQVEQIKTFSDGTPLVFFNYPIAFSGGNSCGLARFDANGDLLWLETFSGGSSSFTAYHLLDIKIQQNDELSFIESFGTTNSNSINFYLHGRLADGTVVFDKDIGGMVHLSTESWTPHIQIPTLQGGYLVVLAHVNTQPQIQETLFRMYDGVGNLILENAYPISLQFRDGIQTSSGSFAMVGNTLNLNKAFLLLTDSTANVFSGLVSGQVFLDANQNCQLDSLEQGTALGSLALNSNFSLQTGYPDSLGQFSIPTVGENQFLIANANSPYLQLCQDSFPVSITASLPFDTVNIPVIVLQECPLMAVDIGLSVLRPCMSATCAVSCTNLGTASAPGATLALNLPNELAFQSASLPLLNQANGVLLFDIGDLDAGEMVNFQLNLSVGCNVQIGDTLCAQAHAFPDTLCSSAVVGTPFLAETCRTVSNSFDPNAKSALPQGDGDQYLIAAGTSLQYRIDFQNTGTDTAFQVAVRDTLSPLLDPTTVRPGASSHAYTWQILEGNVLKFSFHQIMLPDSNTNEPASHGFVQFEIKLKAGIMPYSTINNKAAIFFDFNAPILTNTVFHTILKPVFIHESNYSLCNGDVFNNQVWTADSTLTDTINTAYYDSILTTHIQVLPTYTVVVDTSLFIGEIFQGTPIFSDTVFVQNLTATNGCDSTISTQVTVLSAATDVMGDRLHLRVYPNPTDGEFYIGMDLPSAMNLRLEALDLLGRQVAAISPMATYPTGKHKFTVDARQWASGIYLLRFQMDGKSFYKRIIKA
ncbi:MAG: T9SS type A sorting domain-containing protein [Saprospiraceae bacterium]|nr:T9SS type A sorting domain-containing protein [Saprospiraceae bacterium]